MTLCCALTVWPINSVSGQPTGVSGVVTDEATGLPIAGVCVELLTENGWDPVVATSTATDGSYFLETPDPRGRYYVYVWDCVGGNWVGELWTGFQIPHNWRVFPLGIGTVDIGGIHNVAIERAGQITGVLTGAVTPLCAMATTEHGGVKAMDITDNEGRYLLTGLRPLEVTYLHFSDCTHLPGTTRSRWLMSSTHRFERRHVSVGPGQVREIAPVNLASTIESISSHHGLRTTDFEGDGVTPADPVEVRLLDQGYPSWHWAIDEMASPSGGLSRIVVSHVAGPFGTPSIPVNADFRFTIDVLSNVNTRLVFDGEEASTCGIPVGASSACIRSVENIDGVVRYTVSGTFYLGTFIDVLPTTQGALPVADYRRSVGLVDTKSGYWRLFPNGEKYREFFYGNPGDHPFMGDWDCDGVDTPGLYRRSDGFVYLRNSNTQGTSDIRFFFGNPGDLPMAGDFDGDDCDTVSIYRPSEARMYVINRLGANGGGLGAADYSYFFGNPGDKPFVGDFQGDGVDSIGLHRESTGLVYLRLTNTEGVADLSYIFGDPGDRFTTGWNLGADAPALYRPTTGRFFFKYANVEGIADDFFDVPCACRGSQFVPVGGFFFERP